MSKKEREQIVLNSTGGDAWAWQKEVTGRCCCDKCTSISVRVNGKDAEVARQGEQFSSMVTLDEGKNQIVVACCHADGKQCDSAEVTFTCCLRKAPTARLNISLMSEGFALDGTGSQPCEAGGAPIVKYLWSARKDNPAPIKPDYSISSTGDKAILISNNMLPKVDGEYYFSLKVVDADGHSDTATNYFVIKNGRPKMPKYDVDNTEWVENAVIYGVVPHNFGPEGKGFQAVTEKLDYLKDLGVNTIWLSPSTVTPTGNHGYAVSDYFNLRKDYGTKADLKKLVQEAHARGIRVMMDFVPNHSSIRHPYMIHAQKHGEKSPYYSFYDRDKVDDLHTYYFYWTYLPNLNYENPEVRRWITEAMSYWVREFDIDGYRVDVAWGVKQRRPDYWMEWRRELKRIKPDLLLLGEASARDEYYFDGGYDAVYDWTDELGHWAWEKVFDVENRITLRLNDALTNKGKGYHKDALVFRFLNNNDTGERFITRYGVGLEKVAAAMMLTVPGIPSIYTGQEVGEEYEPYAMPDPISWEDKHGLRKYYKHLIALRKRIPALRSRNWEILKSDSQEQVYAYIRYANPGDDPVLVVMNFSGVKTTAHISVPKRFVQFTQKSSLRDLMMQKGEEVKVNAVEGKYLRLSIPAHSARVLVAGKK